MIEQTARQAKQASLKTATLDTASKNDALKAIAQALQDHADAIVAENQQDLAQAQQDNLRSALLKRLKFDHSKIAGVVEGIYATIALDDPAGKTLSCTQLDDGLDLYKVTCPIGVLGIIFESRPDALVQISTLALKSGNALLLKGGSEAARTNRILADVIYQASLQAGLPEHWMALLETREDVNAMLALDDVIDLIIPRGSNEFVKYIMDNTRIMVLGHADGICHVFIDRDANMDKALHIAFDAKCQYPAVCNAMETLLVHQAIAEEFLPRILEQYEPAGVELRGCENTRRIIDVAAATEEDWATEYTDLILSIKIVEDSTAAINHVNTYGSGHTEAIVTENQATAKTFLEGVDAAGVFWNASTRFADGFRYGLGAEVGISTLKVHARGPVGLEGLVSYKYKLLGQGQTVGEYTGEKVLHHRSSSQPCPL